MGLNDDSLKRAGSMALYECYQYQSPSPFCFAHTQTQDSVHVTKAGSEQAEGSVKTGFQAVTGGVTIQVWEDKFYLITRAVRAGSMTRLHFLTWTTLIMRRADSAKLGQSAKH